MSLVIASVQAGVPDLEPSIILLTTLYLPLDSQQVGTAGILPPLFSLFKPSTWTIPYGRASFKPKPGHISEIVLCCIFHEIYKREQAINQYFQFSSYIPLQEPCPSFVACDSLQSPFSHFTTTELCTYIRYWSSIALHNELKKEVRSPPSSPATSKTPLQRPNSTMIQRAGQGICDHLVLQAKARRAHLNPGQSKAPFPAVGQTVPFSLELAAML